MLMRFQRSLRERLKRRNRKMLLYATYILVKAVTLARQLGTVTRAAWTSVVNAWPMVVYACSAKIIRILAPSLMLSAQECWEHKDCTLYIAYVNDGRLVTLYCPRHLKYIGNELRIKE